ncbi:MAG: single-stranded-DNA-specific exonuclease RecJ [Spirochaetes bacterium]|nr:single-stranded-DNA-specific exonuclease RecJ [Spirochaetota bacterium]
MNIKKKALDLDFIKYWQAKGLHPILLSILNRRGIVHDADLLNIFYPQFENILSPFEFRNIEKAWQRLDKAIANQEKIIVYGDRDVDGTTSITILVDYLTRIGANVQWDLPIGDEPYGLDKEKILSWQDQFDLCITVDCGSTNISEVQLLNQFNIDTIIIDHHQPLTEVPPAYYIMNPKCEKNIEDDDIAACAVVFLFIYGHQFSKCPYYQKYCTIAYYYQNEFLIDVYQNLIKVGSYKSFSEILFLNEIEHHFYISLKGDPAKPKIPVNFQIIQSPEMITHYSQIQILPALLAELSLKHFLLKDIKESICSQYSIFVMLALIADIMPLTGSNRILSAIGLKYFSSQIPDNLEKLCAILELDFQTISSIDIAWKICPVLNAPGRMGDARTTVNFLLDQKGSSKIDQILQYNEQRKLKSEAAYQLFLKNIQQNKKQYHSQLNFFYHPDIDKGITGITANRLADKTNTPVIVAAENGDFYTGSIRGKSKIHFVDFLTKAQNILQEFGGHKKAAGFRFKKENLQLFTQFLMNHSHFLPLDEKEDTINIDAEIPTNYLNYELFSLLKILEPFGNGNENPTFFTPNIQIESYIAMGKEKEHLKIFFNTSQQRLQGIFWNKASWFKTVYYPEHKYNLIYTCEINNWQGKIIPFLNISHLEPAS